MISFSPPDITDLEIQYVTEALKSGWITTGPRVKALEKSVSAFCGCSSGKAVCLNSQTACAEMALRLLGVGPGDEVITTAYTYTATAAVILHVGATPVLIDTAKNSFEMDYDALEQAINERTKVIIPVDLAGVPCNYHRIYDIVQKKAALFSPFGEIQKAFGRIIVLADVAHAFGAEWNGKMAGSIADFSAFSFHAVKNLTTAEGGALTWNSIPGIDDEWIYNRLQCLSLHGQSKDALSKMKGNSWEYDIVGTWYKCNMTDVAAAIGQAQLERYPAMLQRRKEIIGLYDAAVPDGVIEVWPHLTEQYRSSGHLYITRVPGIGEKERGEIITKMMERGIACNVHYKPLPMHTAYKELGFDIADYSNAYARYACEITLPLHTKLTNDDVQSVIDNSLRIVGEYIK